MKIKTEDFLVRPGTKVKLGEWPTAAPWFVVPADDKENARLIVSHIILTTFKGLKMAFPATTAGRRCELKSIRRQL